MEDHGGGRNTLHGVITELTTAPLKITYAGWELFGALLQIVGGDKLIIPFC